MLNKMGWITYSMKRGIGSYHLFVDDEMVRYFIDFNELNTCFIIKEFDEVEKQIEKNNYKFIIMDYNPSILEKGNNKPKFKINKFNTNNELFKLVLKNKAYNKDYQRHFLIQNILYEKN